jgi:hypothetical protein
MSTRWPTDVSMTTIDARAYSEDSGAIPAN